MNLRTWLILKLGGYTKEHYTSLRDKYNALECSYNAIKGAHDATIGWFKEPAVKILMGGNHRTFTAARILTERDQHTPVNVLERQMAQQIAEDMLRSKSIPFELVDGDSSYNMGKVYHGSVVVVIPPER